MKTGNDILENGSIPPISYNREMVKAISKNFQTPQRNLNRLDQHDTFGNLGFKDNTKRDPDFNAHYEFIMRKQPGRELKKGSILNLKSNFKIDNNSERDHINKIRNKVNHTQLDYSNMYFTV
jgi:hypothetical protein